MTPDQRSRCESRIGAAHTPGWMRSPLGCSPAELKQLSPEERTACDRRMAELRIKGAEHPVDQLPPEKRAYYDAVQQAYWDIHYYGTPLAGRVGGQMNSGAMPGRIPAFGCRIPFGSPKGFKVRGPPHGFKLGPLPCYFTPPQGLGTEESGVADPEPANPK